MIYLVLIFSWILFIILPMDSIISNGVANESLCNCFHYEIMHASWLHLIINTIALCSLWFPIRKIYIRKYNEETNLLNFSTYISAVIAGLACATTVPTVGMSGMVYFLLGVLIMMCPTKRLALNYLWVAAACLVQLYFGHTNVALHLFSFMEGVVYICVREFLYQYKNSTGLFESIENADTGPIYTD